jgi:membrane fusion protein, copper/silver efflux system
MKHRKWRIAGGVLLVSLFMIYAANLGYHRFFHDKTSEGAPPSTEGSGHQHAQPPQAQEEKPAVEIPPDKQQLIGVKVIEVAEKPMRKVIRTVGRIDYDERKLRTVNTKVEGWIEKLFVDYVGKFVRQGEPLAEIYSPELYATQQEFINLLRWQKKGGDSSASAISKDVDALVAAARQRLRLWDIPEDQIRKIEEAGEPMRTLTILSPVTGYVIQKMALQGMRVMPGEKLFDVADLSTLWIIADIYEYELPLIRVGENATISLSYFPGREFSSRIDYVYPALAGETRTARVRFTIGNPEGRLKPQMYTNVEIKIDLGKKIAIPDDAVIDTGTRQIVYVDRGEGNFEPRQVTLGLRAEGMREVLKGLKAGDRIAASAAFLIDSEAQIKGIK